MCRSRPASRHLRQGGSLDVYIATALVLPLLVLTLFGGLAAWHVAEWSTDLSFAAQVAAETAALDGGVTPAAAQAADSALADAGISARPVVSGSPPVVPWGQPVTVSVAIGIPLQGFPFTLLGLAGTVLHLGQQEVVDSEEVAPGTP